MILPCGCEVVRGVAVRECSKAAELRRLVEMSEARYYQAVQRYPRDVRGRALALRVARQMYREHFAGVEVADA